MKIKPAKTLKGEVRVPGDKSISHRAAFLASMANGITRIENYSASVDCASTLNCLRELDVKVSHKDSAVRIYGVGKTGFRPSTKSLDCGNSGTTFRLLTGLLSGQDFDSILIGDASLRTRPMNRIIKPLRSMGVSINSNNGMPPLKISGKNPLTPIIYEMPVASAQLKSALILAGLNAKSKTIIKSAPQKRKLHSSRDHTELMLKHLDAELDEEFIRVGSRFQHRITVEASAELKAKDIEIPGDISAASFFLGAASCLNRSEIVIRNVGLNPTRIAVIDILKNMGASIQVSNKRENCCELLGDLRIKGKGGFRKEVSNKINGEMIANLIDEIPLLAVLGTKLHSGLEIRDAKELRVKESDRISAIVTNLKLMNAKIEEFSDGFFVKKSKLTGAEVDSFGDHRIAMALAIAGLFAEGETKIKGADCVEVSFPKFFDELQKVVKQTE